MKVLLIDDSQLIYKIVETIFKNVQHELSWAQNGQLGLEQINSENRYDLILLDWNMPVLDGPGFLKTYRDEVKQRVPIIMLTTENKISYIEKALELGVSEYIMKPFTDDILLSKIESVLSSQFIKVSSL